AKRRVYGVPEDPYCCKCQAFAGGVVEKMQQTNDCNLHTLLNTYHDSPFRITVTKTKPTVQSIQ
ncbi:hypothetical protein CEXT_558121, partial [Caerostris extrusa]